MCQKRVVVLSSWLGIGAGNAQCTCVGFWGGAGGGGGWRCCLISLCIVAELPLVLLMLLNLMVRWGMADAAGLYT